MKTPALMPPTYCPDPCYLSLGEGYADEVTPARFPHLQLRFRNQLWAKEIGLDLLTPEQWLQHFAEFQPLPDNFPKPLAMRYHGHQFRVYNPDIGDGRGFLFAQLRDSRGRLLDLGTKGSGPTPYSRGGDGRLTLKGAVREALATEMLESLGVNTSKTLTFFETGDRLTRNDEPSPTRAAVLTRLSHSHIRFGTLQRFRAIGDLESMKRLIHACLKWYFTDLTVGPEKDSVAAFFHEVMRRSAELCASWMMAGFVHGVLNTDNMNITGESFDYGPYRFLPNYDPRFTAAYFDQTGLYAYGRQPEAVFWNLQQLAWAILPLSQESSLTNSLQSFSLLLTRYAALRLQDRLGVVAATNEDRERLLHSTFEFLSTSPNGFDQFFHDWYGGRLSFERALRESPEACHYQGEVFERFREVLFSLEPLPDVQDRLRDPYFAKPSPCALLIDEIEWIWEAIDRADDWSRFESKIAEIREMGRVYGRRSI